MRAKIPSKIAPLVKATMALLVKLHQRKKDEEIPQVFNPTTILTLLVMMRIKRRKLITKNKRIQPKEKKRTLNRRKSKLQESEWYI